MEDVQAVEIERLRKLVIVDRDKQIVTQGAFNAAMAEIERLRAENEALQYLARLSRKMWNLSRGYTEDGREITWNVGGNTLEELETQSILDIYEWCKKNAARIERG